MKKILSATIGLLFLTALAANVSAGQDGKTIHALPSGSGAQKMDSGDALKAKDQLRQQKEQHIQINKETDGTQVENKDRVRTKY